MIYETSVANKYNEAKKDIYVVKTTKNAYESDRKDDFKSNKDRHYKREGEKSQEKGKKNEEDCEDEKYQDGKEGQKGNKKGRKGGKDNKYGNKEDQNDGKDNKHDDKEDQKKEKNVKGGKREEGKPQEEKKEDDKDKQVVTAPAYEWTYGYNAGHPNPDYCKGFKIEHPTLYDLAYESGSTQEIKWSIDQSQLIAGKEANSIFRIRVLSFGNYNQQVIGEDLDVYNKDNTGSVRFPLDLKNDSGMYKYRVMVNHGNETIHCVYESVPFRIVQHPGKKFDLTPYWVPYKGAIYSQDTDSGMKYHEKRAI
ncbi:uncharacterized protein B0P05DRAFT_465951 [Gilbertella persicaria]|uniref:uncharacterized protein n=1 Tax=Gilbertella persicaria TaxID=101096 RepID=UPI0022204D3E|nr:uncharacterized protein B0P05DRAFT_465951 [Gilbertella persicaria]KAI8086891.1 hypothetical protein B0P05DRAFT_465951 [Gilbertella persicaria]